MDHRYQVGDRVNLAFGFYDHDAVGSYEISALLPTSPDGVPQYIILGSDHRRRVIGQSQIGEPGILASSVWSRRDRNHITGGRRSRAGKKRE